MLGPSDSSQLTTSPTESSFESQDMNTSLSVECLSGFEYMSHNILTKRSLLQIIEVLKSNLPTYIAKLRNHFRSRRRQVNSSAYRAFVASNLSQYSNIDNIARGNLHDVL